MSFRSTVIRSSVVNVASSVVLRLATLAQNIILARVFLPEQLGQLATVILVVQFLTMFTHMGLNESIVRDKKAPQAIMNTAMTLSLVMGLGLMALMFAVAPLLAALFRRPELTDYLRALSVLVLAYPLDLPNVMWVKRFRFGVARAAQFVELVFSIGVTLLAHFMFDLGVWSLFYGKLAGFATRFATVWIIAPYRPRLEFDRKYAGQLYRFGWPLVVSALGNYLIWEGDDWLVRILWGDAALAFYVLAFGLPFYLKGFADILISSLLPTYSELKESPEKTATAFGEVNRYMSIMLVPCAFLLFVLAEPLILQVYGAKWSSAILPLKLFALGFTIEVNAGYSWGILALAKGKTKYLMYMRLWITSYLFTVGALLIYNYGIVGGAIYTLTQAILTVGLVRPWILYRELGSLKYLRDSWKPLVASAVPGGLIGVFAINYIDSLLMLAAFSALYFIGYAVIYVVMDRSIIRDARQIGTVLLGPQGARS